MAYQKHNFKDGDILKAEHLNCIEDCIAEAPNWNAAEGEPGHVLNRTHWVEPGKMVDILPDTSTFSDEEDPGMFELPGISLAAGDTYIVSWNGTEYTCVGLEGTAMGEAGAVALGDVYTASGGMVGTAPTGEPFVIVATPEVCMAIAIDGSTKLFISIKKVTETVHKLDGKYLPDGVPYAIGSYGTILPDFTITSEEDMARVPRLGLIPGNTYTVKIAGFGEWTCTAVTAMITNGFTFPVVGIGNLGDWTGVNTGEPFALIEIPPAYAAEVGMSVILQPLVDDFQLPVTFSIRGSRKEIRKLDNDCLDLDWKPNYTEIPLVPEVTITGGELVDVGVDINPKDDETFVVYYDGVRYVAKGISSMDIEGIGDITFASTPFFIHTVGTKIGIYGASTTHTVAIYRTSAPTLPNDMIPTNLSPLLLYSDGEYIYTDQERTTRIRGEQFLDNFKTRRIVIGTMVNYDYYVPLRTDADRVNYSGSILVTVMATGGESPTFKQLKTGSL